MSYFHENDNEKYNSHIKEAYIPNNILATQYNLQKNHEIITTHENEGTWNIRYVTKCYDISLHVLS